MLYATADASFSSFGSVWVEEQGAIQLSYFLGQAGGGGWTNSSGQEAAAAFLNSSIMLQVWRGGSCVPQSGSGSGCTFGDWTNSLLLYPASLRVGLISMDQVIQLVNGSLVPGAQARTWLTCPAALRLACSSCCYD
jgi:hypothetical protein